MIDSHSHIYCDAFDDDREEMLARAREAGIAHIVMPNENVESLARLKAVLDAHPDYVSATIGLHPEEIGDDFRDQLHAMHTMLAERTMPFVAVGEIGIDLYWEQDKREEQLEALDTQLRWCKEFDLPFIIHCREGVAECLQVMDNFGESLPQGVFHSFTGTPADIEAIRKRGDFYFGVNGIVTFKKVKSSTICPRLASTGYCLKPTRLTWHPCPSVENATRVLSPRMCATSWRQKWAYRQPNLMQ